MSGAGLNSRTASGLRTLQNTNIVSAVVSGDGLIAMGENVNLEGFQVARAEQIENKHGPLEVNAISSEAPISSIVENGTANVSLKFSSRDFEIGPENDLQSKNGPLVAEAPLWIDKQMEETLVGLHYGAPFYTSEHGLSLMTDDTTITIDSEGKLKSIDKNFETPLEEVDGAVRLNIETPLVVKDGKLGVDQKELSKGIGAISVYSAMDEILPGVGDWIDIPDLPGDMEEYIGNGTLVKLNCSDDFQQTGSRLAIRSKGMNEIPYYGGLSGFNSSNHFTYNETLSTLTAPRFEAEAVDYSITEQKQLPTAGYVHQLYQSQAGSAIDISEVANGRKLIRVNHDTTLNVNEANQLEVNVANLVDTTSVKAVNGKLSVDIPEYSAGDGISIVDKVVSSTLTYGGSLRREGDQVIGKTVISGSSNVTVTQTNPFSYAVSVTSNQSQLDNLEDKVDDLNEKTDQNKTETDNKLNDLENEDIRLDNKIDAIQGDLISLGAEVTGLTGVVDTVNTVATGVQVAQALMKGDVTSLQGIATSLGAQITGLDSVVTAYTSLPVVRTIVGVGLIVVQDPVTGLVTITNTSAPLMAEKPPPPVNPENKGGGGGTLKDTYKNEEGGGGLNGGGGTGGDGTGSTGGGGGGLNGGGSVGESSSGSAEPDETPILPPINPVDLQNTGRIGGTDGNDLLSCLNGLPPIFKGRDDKGENTWFVDSWGRRWSEELQLEVIEDGIERSLIELDERGVPVTEKGHIDIILRGSDDDRISTAILTHDRHLQSGYIQQGGILFEHPTTVPNIAMVYQAYEQYILPYVESCNFINVGQGIVKDGNTLSLSEDLSTFAKTSSIKSLGFKDTLSYSELTGRPTLGSLAAKNSIAWTEVTSRPTLGTLSSKNTLDWNGTDIINKPTDLTTKTYVDSLSYLTVGSGLVKTGSTISLGSDLGAFEVKSNLKALAYKDSLSWTEITSKPTLGTLASKSSVSWTTEVANKPTLGTLSTKNNIDYNSTDIINKPDLSIYETKTSLKGFAYKDKVDYAADVINAPASVTYGSGLLFSNNTVSLNPAVSVDTLTTTSGISVGANVYATGNVDIGGAFFANRSINGGFNHILNNQSSASTSCTSLHLKAGGTQGLYLHINSASRGSYGGVNTATIQNYAGALRLLGKTESGGIIIDTLGSVTIPTSLSVGALNLGTLAVSGSISVGGCINVSGGGGIITDIVSFPPANMTAETTLITGQTYGNGTYIATASSVYNNSTYYTPWRAFETGSWYPLVNSYSGTAPYSYVRGITTLVDSVSVAGEWIQLQMPVAIILSSFDITSSTTSRFIKDFDLVGSDDNGTTFTSILSSTMNWGTGSVQTINIPVPKSAKAFNTYRLICKSMAGSSTFCTVNKLVFNGLPALDIKGAICAKQVVTENLICSGDVSVDALKVNKIFGDLSIDNSVEFKDDIVDLIKYPQIQLSGATTQGYIANASSYLNGTSAGWKAFTNSLEINDSYWSASTYSGGEQNLYQGTVQTSVDGTNIKGEYVELEMPEAIAITAFSFEARTPEMPLFPKDYIICGSDDRNTWTEINSGKMTYTIYQNSTSVNRYVPFKNYTTKKFKVFRFIIRNLISGTYGHIGKLTFYGSNATQKIIDAPSAKVNGLSLTAPAYGMFQLHSSQSFSVNGTAYQLITKWTPSFGMESETIYCSTNSQDIVIKLPGIYKVEFDLDCFQSGSGSVNSYFGFMSPGATVYYEDGYHVRKHSMVAGQKVTGSSICCVVEADTKMILRFISASSSGGITGSQASRLIIYRIAPLA
ncbi:hypothetical protein BC832DRAFT_596123 [Gaertneriomyces semiglobifer]|nr:hypothetical protein BC832DRAFT_596123 [Gaertneriomyces semiglobifer]